jgi:hypothetical protein
MSDKNSELRAQFEAQASDPSFKFARSRKGTYVNPALARDWKWFQAGVANQSTEAAAMAATVPAGKKALIEAVTKAILFEDTGSTESWEDNLNLGEAAVRVCDVRNPPRCSYCHSATGAPVAGQPAEPSPAGDYLDGVNIPELTRALVWLGVATGGQEEMAARLSWYVNQIVSAVLRHRELWSASKGDSNG